jgi:hypothetical protein
MRLDHRRHEPHAAQRHGAENTIGDFSSRRKSRNVGEMRGGGAEHGSGVLSCIAIALGPIVEAQQRSSCVIKLSLRNSIIGLSVKPLCALDDIVQFANFRPCHLALPLFQSSPPSYA